MRPTLDEVILYSVPGCEMCRQAREYLLQRRVRFREINVLVHPKAVLEFVSLCCPVFPIIVVGDKFLVGFSRAQLLRLLRVSRR
ncbi:MAG: glutaredoxin family protein [Verrucomicrobia bacterium]|nr:glutaredoxin family protein [Verrucomicrobiota bacterium]